MANHLSYEDSIKGAYKGLLLLGVVTLAEVGVSLFFGPISPITKVISALILIAMAAYKAYFIVGDFMHMKFEAKGLAMTVLLPLLLLVWALIAFLQEAGSWGARRAQVQEFNKVKPTSVAPPKVEAAAAATTGDTLKATTPATTATAAPATTPPAPATTPPAAPAKH
jgi:cytochrome c oxidase subunit IV